jgi:hypothetical protein
MRPIFSVAAASAGSNVNGSNDVTVRLCLSASSGHVQHREMIGHEERVEEATLQRLREALQVNEGEIGVGIAPCAGVVEDR